MSADIALGIALGVVILVVAVLAARIGYRMHDDRNWCPLRCDWTGWGSPKTLTLTTRSGNIEITVQRRVCLKCHRLQDREVRR